MKFVTFGKPWGGCFGRLLHKKCKVCPEYPLLWSGGLCHGFFKLTLQERVMLGQSGREANRKNNDLANRSNVMLLEFHTSLFSTHPMMWYLWQTLKWPQLFNTIKARFPPDLNLEASIHSVTFVSPRVLPWSSLACILTWSTILFSWVLFNFDFWKCPSTSTLSLTEDRGEWRRRVLPRSSLGSLQCERRWVFAVRRE